MNATDEMTCFAGVDGVPGGWAVVVMALNRITIQKVVALSDLFDDRSDLKIVAIDVPMVSSKVMNKVDVPVTGQHGSFSADTGPAVYFRHLSDPR